MKTLWICDLCGDTNEDGASCVCGCDERSWLPVEPQRVTVGGQGDHAERTDDDA
jgi:hypothetical protein